jgi:hypothetical protein
MEPAIGTGESFLTKELCEALGLDARRVARVVIDLQWGQVAMVYVEQAASPRAIDVLPITVKGAQIRIVDGLKPTA